MKLNNIVNESITDTYKELSNDFITEHGTTGFTTTINGIIEYNKPEGVVVFNDGYNAGYRRYLDKHTNTSILRFGKFDSSVVIAQLPFESLKNMPNYVTREYKISELFNIDSFDLDLQYCSILKINKCDFSDLTNIDNVFERLVLQNLPKINCFNVLPGMMKPINLLSLSIDSDIKTTNNEIYYLQLTNIYKFKNFKNLPSKLISLRCNDIVDFESFVGIDECKNLTDFTIRTDKINNIITLMLCPQISNNVFKDDLVRIFFNDTVNDIMNQWLEIYGKWRTDHVMDCAVELIDAGFPEAAEL